MAANKSQGSFYGLFMVAATVLCVGFFFWGQSIGILLVAIGAAGLLASLFGFMKIKPLEGKTALKSNPLAMKLVGAGLCALGWVINLFGMHLTPSVGGRLVLSLIGIAVTLFGMIVVLPAAFNKNAVWKS